MAKPIFMLTVEELMEALLPALGNQTSKSSPQKEEKDRQYVYGVRGLANLLGCSVATAQRRLSSGILDQCVTRTGRLIIIDREAAVEALKGGKR